MRPKPACRLPDGSQGRQESKAPIPLRQGFGGQVPILPANERCTAIVARAPDAARAELQLVVAAVEARCVQELAIVLEAVPVAAVNGENAGAR